MAAATQIARGLIQGGRRLSQPGNLRMKQARPAAHATVRQLFTFGQPSASESASGSSHGTQAHPNIQKVRDLYNSPGGVINRSITGSPGKQNPQFRSVSEIMNALSLFYPSPVESASLLVAGVKQTTFSPVSLLFRRAKVEHVSNCDIDLRAKWDEKFVTGLPLKAKLFPGTEGRRALAKTIVAKGGDPVSTIKGIAYGGDAVSLVNELRIRYKPADILCVGLTYAQETVQKESQHLTASDIQAAFDKEKSPDHGRGLVDDIATALFAKAALETKTGLEFPIGCYDGTSFEEIKFPDDFLEVAKKQYQDHKSSFESAKLDFKNALRLFIKIFLVAYALKETAEHLATLHVIQAKERTETADEKGEAINVLGEVIKHTAEGFEHIADHMTDPEVGTFDKVKTGARLAIEGFVSYISVAPVFSAASFPLVALSKAAKTIGFLGLVESAHGHALAAESKQEQGPDASEA